MNRKPTNFRVLSQASIDWGVLAKGLRAWLPTRGNVIFTLMVVASFFGASKAGAISLGMPSAVGTSTSTIAYQGRLANASGAALTGTYPMTFCLYNVATGGTPLWEEYWTGVNSVQVNGGVFNVMLGSLNSIPQSLLSGNSSLWLGIDVGTDAEMTPRVQIGSVPYAFQSQHAERANGLSAPDGNPADAVTVDNDGHVLLGAANPQAKMQIGGQGGLLRLWNEDMATVPTSYVEFSLGNINRNGGNMNNWLSLDSYGDGYAGTLFNGSGDSLPLSRADVIEADGESMIFANYLHKPFYFMQGVEDSYNGPGYVPLTIDANGNIGIGTTNPSHPLETKGGAYVTAEGVWTNSSDRNLKENFTAIDGKSLLEKVASLPISEWNYKVANSSVKHIGPMAQDFYAAFNLGEDDKHISTVDASGVALAAIQGLDQQVKEQDSRIAVQQQQITDLKSEKGQLEQRVTSMDSRLTALERSGSAPQSPVAELISGWNLVVLAIVAGLSVAALYVAARSRGLQQ